MNNSQLEVAQESAELIPQPTAELIEKSFAQNTIRNRRRNRHDRLTTLRHLTMPKKSFHICPTSPSNNAPVVEPILNMTQAHVS